MKPLIIPLFLGLTISICHAGSGTWASDASGNWNTTTSWTGGTTADGIDANASFTNDITADRIVTLDAPHTLGSITFGDAATATAGGWTISGANTLTLATTTGTPTITINALGTAKNATISSGIAGTAGLTTAGVGAFNLAGTNTFTGGLKLNGTGVTTISGTNATQIWTISGGSFNIGMLLNNTGAIASGSTLNVAPTGNGSSGIQIADNIGTVGTGSSIVSTGTGRTNLALGNGNTLAANIDVSGNSSNTFQFNVGTNATISGNITLGNTLLSVRPNFGTILSGVSQSATGTLTLSGNITGSSSAAIFGNSTSGGGNFTGTIVLTGNNSSFAGLVEALGGTISFSAANGTRNNLGTGALYFGSPTQTGAANSTWRYTGTGDVVTNSLIAANPTGTNTIDQTGTGLLKFTSALTATGAGSKTLTLQGSTAGSGEMAGAIVDNSGTNKTAVTKAGTGAWTLSGANTYTGATTVNGGTLNITGSLTSAVTVNSASTLMGSGSTNGALALNNGAILFGSPGTVSGNNGTSFTAATINSSAAGIKVLGSVAADGTVDIARYTGTWTGASSDFDLSAFRSATAVTSVPGATGNKLQFTINKLTDTWTQASGTWDNTHAAGQWSNSGENAYYSGDDAVFGDLIGQPSATVALGTTVTPSSITVNNSTTNYTIGGTGSIAGNTGLTKSGTGMLTLGTANTFTGQTDLTAGTIILANGSALQNSTLNNTGGTLAFDSSVTSNAFVLGGLSGSQTLALQNNAGSPAAVALTIGNNNASTTYSGALSGAGSLTKIGTGALTLSGTNTYTGKTFLSGGVTQISADSGFGTAPGAVVADQLTFGGGSLQFGAPVTLAVNRGVKLNSAATFDSNGNAVTVDGVISGTGALTKTGAGTLTLTKANTHSGGTTVLAGTLQVSNANATTNKATTLNGGNLTITNGVTYNIDNGLTFASNTNATVAAASGTASLQGFDINSADVIANTGVTASIASSVGLNTGTYGFRIDNTGDLAVAGVVSGNGSDTGFNMTGQYTGTDRGALYKLGVGTLTLTGVSTFTSSGVPVASVQNGTLKLSGGNDRLPVTSGMYLGQGTTSGRLILDGISQTVTSLKNVGTGTANAVVGGNATLSTLTVNNTNAYTFAGAIGGAGTNENNLALVKSGSGALTLSGTNTYTGDTTVNAGKLSLSSAYLADSSKVSLGASGAVLDLNYAGSDTVNQLFIGGSQQALGTWGSSASPATHIDDVHFSGTGMLTVTAGPANAYDAWATARGLTVANSAKDQDPDGDGWNNLKEFAFDGDPLSGASGGKTLVRIATVGTDRVLVLTLPVRSSATFPPAGNVGELVSSVTDGITYHIQAGVDLAIFPVSVDQVTAPNIGTLHDNLPALSSGWSYRSFFVPGSDPAMNSKVFIRATVTE